ncbi:hypothetical protein SAM23877_3137 [Streptomyces ambofaciens ATCC 23877]|uniref:Uncharacterized protein n=1 Tax=Streptomyces ambofaciens (strain ATCC 23877 / 3486 / DSM 40053 / JCM 4204 / NBRC 12836 / NRRL B-2516) TaxID=278992 RepID=A0A0K2ATC7_STRA7|nr:hypothetical protein SAM23877_3137 [Streptomyces ambofaciens ATCC 23877]
MCPDRLKTLDAEPMACPDGGMQTRRA